MTVATLLLSLSLVASGAPADLAPAAPTLVEAPDEMPVILVDGEIRMDPIYVGLGDPIAPAYCIADCSPDGPDVDCTGDTCSAVDRNCSAGQRGYVTCDGYTTFCPTCGGPPGVECTDGDVRDVPTGSCCGSRASWEHFQVCQNGHWVTTATFCQPDPTCPL